MPLRSSDPVTRVELRRLGLILLLALAHGLVYTFLLPPWQHYDEPKHFEYTWLAANLGRLPAPNDGDQRLNRRVLASMIANGFYDRQSAVPVLGAEDQPVEIPGYSQLDDPPLYYLLASLPLRLMRQASVENQLYASRLVSLLLYLATVLCGWGAAREITAPRSPLRWMTPLTLAMLPAFTDLMTSVNNDVGAVAAFSFFLWGSVRLMRRGFSLGGLAWVGIAAALCYLAKNTAWMALLLLPIVMVFSMLRGRWRGLAWGLALALAVGGLLFGFSRDEAAAWYRAATQPGPVRQASDQAVLGDYIFHIDSGAQTAPTWFPSLYQAVPEASWGSLPGKPVTLGAWMWASETVQASTPVLGAPGGSFSQVVEVGRQPRFQAIHAVLPEGTQRVWVSLDPGLGEGSPAQVFYDGLVLAEGERPLDEAPSFSAPDGAQGIWGGQPFTNLIRNPSAELPGLRLNPLVDRLSRKASPDGMQLSLILGALWDWPATLPVLLSGAEHLFRTFWARFAWGQVLLMPGYRPYRWLLAATLFGLLGAGLALVRRRRRVPWDVAFVFGLSLLLAWFPTLTRILAYLPQPKLYFPTARHAYPAILPAAFVLSLGWLEIARLLANAWDWLAARSPWKDKLPRIGSEGRFSAVVFVVFFAGFLILDLLSIYSIARYYGKL